LRDDQSSGNCGPLMVYAATAIIRFTAWIHF
jgi:hypothetical protein